MKHNVPELYNMLILLHKLLDKNECDSSFDIFANY